MSDAGLVVEMPGIWLCGVLIVVWVCRVSVVFDLVQKHVAFLCSSHPVFSPCISLVSKWCIHTVVMTQPHLGRNLVLFYQWDQISIWSNNLSIVVNALARRMLTLLSVDEILLLRYVNWSTNFRGLPLRVEMVPSCLKHMNSILYEPT